MLHMSRVVRCLQLALGSPWLSLAVAPQPGEHQCTAPERSDGQTHGSVLLQQDVRYAKVAKVELNLSRGDPAQAALVDRSAGWEQHVHAELSADGLSAVVKLPMQGGRLHEYHLQLASVYSSDAVIALHGVKTQQGSPAQQRFASWTPGRRASAVVHSNNSISGLFQYGSQLLRLQPLLAGGSASRTGKVLSALQTSRGHLHAVQTIGRRELKAQLSRVVATQAPAFEIAIDDVGPESDHQGGEAEGGPLAPLEFDELPSIEAADEEWNGEKWYPGCYPGDDGLHALRLGVATDQEAWRLYGDELQGMVEGIVSEASLVYEVQMNLRLEIGDLQIYQAPGSSSQPRWASASCVAGEEVRQKFNSFSEWSPPSQQAVWHMFTGCGNGFGTIGLARVGVTCRSGTNTAVNMLRNIGGRRAIVQDTWTTFAHELGHNLAARHSFEEGQGRTGGIMDYGDGKLNGIYQFNTKYRKAQMCDELTSKKPRCGNLFAAISKGSGGSNGGGGSGTCADEDGNCRFYTQYCYAENVKSVCKKTCGLCSIGTTTASTTTTTSTTTSRRRRSGTCADEDGNCRFYTNYCSAENVKAVCKKTCGLC